MSRDRDNSLIPTCCDESLHEAARWREFHGVVEDVGERDLRGGWRGFHQKVRRRGYLNCDPAAFGLSSDGEDGRLDDLPQRHCLGALGLLMCIDPRELEQFLDEPLQALDLVEA